MRRPRLTVLTSYFPCRAEPYRGHSAYQTLRRMGDWADISVVVAVPVYPRLKWLQPRSYRYTRTVSYEPPQDMSVQYREYPVLPVITRPLNGWSCARAVEPALRAVRPDIILNYWLYPEGWAAVHLAQRLGVPAVVGGIGSDLRRIPDGWTRRLTRWTLRQAAGVITVSEELRQQAIALGARAGSSFTVVNGCDTSIFHPQPRTGARIALGLPHDAEIVLYVGNLIPSKGLLELRQAAEMLAGRHPRLTVVCVGEGVLKAELGQSSRFRLPGRAFSAEVAQWMAAADVFCLPSYSEGCPNVVVEALACGRATVASRVGGIPELVRESNGILTEPRDAVALADALERALSHAWDEPAISAAANRSWDDAARDTITALECVLSACSAA